MSLRRAAIVFSFAAGLVGLPAKALAVDLILNNTTISLGGTQAYGIVSLTNNEGSRSRRSAAPSHHHGQPACIKANSITIDALSAITGQGARATKRELCLNGAGPPTTPLSGGRGGCGVRDSGGGGAHFGGGGRGTKDMPGTADLPARLRGGLHRTGQGGHHGVHELRRLPQQRRRSRRWPGSPASTRSTRSSSARPAATRAAATTTASPGAASSTPAAAAAGSFSSPRTPRRPAS